MPPRWKKKSSKKFLKTINKPPLSWLLGTKTWLVISGKTELQKNPKSWRKQLKEMYRALKTSQNCKRVDKKCINFYKSRIQIKKFLTFWVKNSIKKARWRKCSKTRIKGGTTKSLRKSEKTKRYPNKKEAGRRSKNKEWQWQLQPIKFMRVGDLRWVRVKITLILLPKLKTKKIMR